MMAEESKDRGGAHFHWSQSDFSGRGSQASTKSSLSYLRVDLERAKPGWQSLDAPEKGDQGDPETLILLSGLCERHDMNPELTEIFLV